jgi:hypothetical protein
MKAPRATPAGLGSSLLVLSIAAACAQASCSGDVALDAEYRESAECLAESSELYDQRIAPILATDRPKTCNQCHLSGVDLSLFVRGNMCETRACLLELGLVNPDEPEASVVLSWIQRANPESELITEQVIQEEYDAFKSFVEQIATCSGASCAGVRCPTTGKAEACGSDTEPSTATLVPEGTGCDALSMEAVFRDTVYVWRDRCFPCHFATEPQANLLAPRWVDTRGGCEAGSIATLHNMEEGGYFNLEQNDQSLLLLKPLPHDEGGIEHGGDVKFNGTTDRTYQSWLSFIEYYTACQTGTTMP